MKYIRATLPALGTYNIPFHSESIQVLEFLTDAEIERLGQVEHLGTAAKVFTGVNHSRLEYTLLQCAIINLLPRFHKDNEQFSISNKVYIAGRSQPISSGEELLKSWAILSNCGHMHLTYGPERALLRHARENNGFRQILLNGLWKSDIKAWCQSVIDEFDDANFHYVNALYRVCSLPKKNKTKGLFLHMLRNLLLPLDVLEIDQPERRYKLYKLRNIYKHIRLLSIVTLDAYYSHHPIRYQINGVLMNLSQLIDEGSNDGFLHLLERTAGWLADEIYLHPLALGVLRQYEIDADKKLRGSYKKHFEDKKSYDLFFANLLRNGFGKPSLQGLSHLIRLSFRKRSFVRYLGTNVDNMRSHLESKLVGTSSLQLSIATNPFTDTIHVDIFHKTSELQIDVVGDLYPRLYRWLSRRLKATSLLNLRRVPGMREAIPDDLLPSIHSMIQHQEIEKEFSLVASIFHSIIQYVLPIGYRGEVSEYIPSGNGEHPLAANFQQLSGEPYTALTDRLERIISDNPGQLSVDRIHELKALFALVKRSKAPLVIAPTEKFVIRNEAGITKDDWDGVVVEIFEDSLTLKIVEAKNINGAEKRENHAFNQLADTRDMLSQRHKIRYRRQRLRRTGAYLELNFNSV